VDSTGLVATLRLRPFVPTLTSWSEPDTRLRTLAQEVSFSMADGCRQVHEVNATRTRPLASAFKLYVLAALGRAVDEGRAGWDQELAVRERWKSLPTDVLQDEPAGTRIPLRQ